jgi:alkylation response protein AidB-like acyl-CoA dehydrogenase
MRPRSERPILALTESRTLLQAANQFAALVFDSAIETDRTGIIDRRLWTQFRHAGLAISPFPKEFGGAGLWDAGRYNDLCAILRLLGSADLSVARLFEGHVNAVSLVARYGDRAQLESLSERVREGSLSAVWGAAGTPGPADD